MVHDLSVAIVEGRETGNHLKDECTEGPPIHSLAISMTIEDFRSYIFRCTYVVHKEEEEIPQIV